MFVCLYLSWYLIERLRDGLKRMNEQKQEDDRHALGSVYNLE